MATNSRYITTKALEEYFVDKTTGQPLAGGTVEFYKDNDRLIEKDVYQLSGAPPNYTFEALANPITLSSVGTIQNTNGDNVALYYLPYTSDEAGSTVEKYYVVIKNSDGVEQFTRENWPDIDDFGSGEVGEGTAVNQISNSQFVTVLFEASSTLTISFTGNSTTTVDIAPDWKLEITHSDAGSLTVARNNIAGNQNIVTNPPYTLTITPGNNITGLKLIQRLANNPDIWVPSTTGVEGYLAGGILLGNGSSVTMNYVPSSGTTQEIFTASNSSGATAYFGDTVQLTPGDNSQNASTGYVEIELVLAVGAATTLSSVQVLGVDTDETDISYRQDSVNRQKDYLAHYYNPLLQYKPLPSYLVGWDFALNPAQFLGTSVAAQAVGANKSYYAWDQTILFQTTDSGITTSRGTNGSLKTLSADASGTQIALVQYLGQTEARKLLNSRKCVHVMANASTATTVTISLWYTTDVSLPDVSTGTNNSIVLTLDSNGKPATRNGTWTELSRSNLGDATFTVGTSSTTEFNEYSFAGWDLEGAAATNTATFFAIVVGTASLAQNDYIEWSSISLQDGDIATRPAPMSIDAVLKDCQYYYEKSFNYGVTPAQNVGTNMGETSFNLPSVTNPQTFYFYHQVYFKAIKRATPTIVLYNPSAASATIRDTTTSTNISNALGSQIMQGYFAIGTTATPGGGEAAGDLAIVNWTADARLGIV